jgi:hypothetical protein
VTLLAILQRPHADAFSSIKCLFNLERDLIMMLTAKRLIVSETEPGLSQLRSYRRHHVEVLTESSKRSLGSTHDACSISRPSEKNAKKSHHNPRDLPYESALAVLRVYHAFHGNLVLPRRYIVPENVGYPEEWVGLDLASSVYNMKWWQRNIKERPERVHELNQLGFIWERLQPQWNIVLEALVTYHSLFGDVLVPSKFIVPHGDRQWPKATWGVPLGNCIYRIRSRNDFLSGPNSASRRSQLERLGFVWDVYEQRFDRFYCALRHFVLLHCHQTGRPTPVRVPSTFVIPENDDQWPRDLWKYPLGAKCSAVRQKGLYVKNKPKRQQMLEQLGFRWSGNANLSWLKVVHAAAIYSKIHHRDLDVPFKFVVPAPPKKIENHDDDWPWPEHLWHFPLGQRLKEIRVTGAYLKGTHGEERRRQLDALGFVWDVQEHRFLKFYTALHHFANLKQLGKFNLGTSPKALVVPTTFVIPANDEAWPVELRKYRLGSQFAAVRRKGLYIKNHQERREMLEDLGFIIDDNVRHD